MPIIGTPAANNEYPCCDNTGGPEVPPAAVPCENQGIFSAPVTTQHGRSVLSRLRAIRVTAGRAAVLDWNMHDRDGKPIDLSGCECGSGGSEGSDGDGCLAVELYVRENLSSCTQTIAGEIVDTATGQVRVSLAGDTLVNPGIYFAEIAVVDESDLDAITELPRVVVSNVFKLIVERGAANTKGPPTIAEIRLHLRDSHPSENHLLDNLKFDDAEIALAIERPIQYWNEVPPPLRRYTTSNFPHRYHWLEAICGQLFLMVAEQMRAGNLTYQAAGVSVNDMDKEQNYEAAAQRRNMEWKQFVRARKASDNISGAYGGLGSPYGS